MPVFHWEEIVMSKEKRISRTRWRQMEIERKIIQKLKMFAGAPIHLPEIEEYVDITSRGQTYYVGKTLRTIMDGGNIDVPCLSWHTQVSEETIYKMRRAERLAGLETLLKLAQALEARVVLTFDPFASDDEIKPERQTLVLDTPINCRRELMWFLRWLRGDGQSRQAIALRGAISATTIAKIEEQPNHCANWESIFRLSAGLLYRPCIHLFDNPYWCNKWRQPSTNRAC
jgi:hypothetical protein